MRGALSSGNCTVQKLKFSITDFFSKCDQICSFLWIWSHLRDKSLMELIFFIWYCRWFFLNHHLKSHRRINITCYGKTEVSFAKSLVFVNNVSYRVNSVSYRNRSIDLQQKFFTEKVIKWNFSEVSLLVTSDKYFTNEKRRLCALETTSKFLFLILSKVKYFNCLLFPRFSEDFRGKRSWLIRLNSLKIRNETSRQSITQLDMNFFLL